ncbi:hypothetical protein O181_041403 [Austropuccinia psidii MF-1]|uniref:Uncharacterized protein n=1 Tax=Austropuccinia psidii MF-1 TaxID=1389203 RepID=A0A9Q3DJ34_9BASI|nr:hypothetical protein [Austropuccinia psidii MF-1]
MNTKCVAIYLSLALLCFHLQSHALPTPADQDSQPTQPSNFLQTDPLVGLDPMNPFNTSSSPEKPNLTAVDAGKSSALNLPPGMSESKLREMCNSLSSSKSEDKSQNTTSSSSSKSGSGSSSKGDKPRKSGTVSSTTVSGVSLAIPLLISTGFVTIFA